MYAAVVVVGAGGVRNMKKKKSARQIITLRTSKSDLNVLIFSTLPCGRRFRPITLKPNTYHHAVVEVARLAALPPPLQEARPLGGADGGVEEVVRAHHRHPLRRHSRLANDLT